MLRRSYKKLSSKHLLGIYLPEVLTFWQNILRCLSSIYLFRYLLTNFI